LFATTQVSKIEIKLIVDMLFALLYRKKKIILILPNQYCIIKLAF